MIPQGPNLGNRICTAPKRRKLIRIEQPISILVDEDCAAGIDRFSRVWRSIAIKVRKREPANRAGKCLSTEFHLRRRLARLHGDFGEAFRREAHGINRLGPVRKVHLKHDAVPADGLMADGEVDGHMTVQAIIEINNLSQRATEIGVEARLAIGALSQKHHMAGIQCDAGSAEIVRQRPKRRERARTVRNWRGFVGNLLSPIKAGSEVDSILIAAKPPKHHLWL